ncbi:MAG: STAS-like domain-containing protein [Candidatus Uhrbacteria bacterium]
MKINFSKFGTTLTSRQAGREALAALQPSLATIGKDEKIEIDFSGVITFSPSWGDEVITPLKTKFGERLILKNTENPSVSATLEMLDNIFTHQNN